MDQKSVDRSTQKQGQAKSWAEGMIPEALPAGTGVTGQSRHRTKTDIQISAGFRGTILPARVEWRSERLHIDVSRHATVVSSVPSCPRSRSYRCCLVSAKEL